MFIGGIFLDDPVAYLLGRKSLVYLQPVGQQRFIDANGAMSRVIVNKTCVQTLVAKSPVAMAVAGKLRESFRNLFRNGISVHRLAKEFLRRQRWWKLPSFGGGLISRDFRDSRLIHMRRLGVGLLSDFA